ncbi:PaaI family thioesterase [Erythrobacter alti]|uniref:PaaI family thioesterase n=1 Tax=Erythrobacter alti TaxID=1896145 RepID=UPI0030F3E323
MTKIPDGFSEMRSYGAFHELIGPLYWAKRGENIVVGVHFDERHGNAVGSLHGGMLMALVDTALTLAAGRAAPKGQYAVTQGISADFLSPAMQGDWVEAEAEVLRAGRSTISLDCRVRKRSAKGKLLMRASGTFHVIAAQ